MNVKSPPNGGVCAFAETSTNFPEPGDYKIAVTGEDGNTADPSSFPGSSTGTPVEVGPGGYSITELQASTGQLQNELQATSIITTTTATGDCKAQFNNNQVFIEATGTLTSGDSQECTIINTLTISGGQVPDTLTG